MNEKKGLPSRFSPIIAGKFSQSSVSDEKEKGEPCRERIPRISTMELGTTIQPGQRYSWLKLSPYLNFKLLTRRPGVIRDREKEGGRGRNSREKIPGTKLRRIVGIETRAWIHIGWEYFVGIPPTSIESLFAPNTGVTWALKFVSYFADTEQSYRREKFSGHQLSFLVWFIVYC